MPKRPGTYGPGVVGEERYQVEARIRAKRADKYGKGVTDADDAPSVASPTAPPPPTTAVQLPPDQDGNGYSSIKELQAAIAAARENPEALDALIPQALALELQRTGPDASVRKGALMELLTAENGRAGGARPEVHQLIEQALTQIARAASAQ